LTGARGNLPPALSSAAFGFAFGALAQTIGLSLAETTLMSALVFAGSAQYPALLVWTFPPAILPLALTTLAINARHLLYGAAVRPWMGDLSTGRAYLSLFFLSDSNWLTAMRDWTDGERDRAILLGGGIAMCLCWTGGTVAGHLSGAALGDIGRFGIDVAVPAFFVALLVSAWRGRADILPLLAGAAAALIAERLLPPGWHILVGSMAGASAGMLRRAD
ncbi:MAG TPA: AzlC family ABC transporter permease, partial [Reyranella sp.]|nr:AzlC family ABC transporter permease [Reyranella sp.]